MSQALLEFQQRAEELKKKMLERYASNKALAKQLIKSSEQNADYRITEKDTEEKWFYYLIEELNERLQ